ncbi:MAG: AI-2E family transporter [Actinomycetota bacterium]|nr:AI-2E family transporter [Actinomycetota bacterium]MED5220802.1 AI-2E family transporter [Actinomycetota bacterium]MED5232250.1 AI-2E family transporter [Actinomycetota bacterium]MED5394932.1 AI-2E family transporter [Actinomycetota bacterium]MEE3354447.1 AI-2E family transporter [Actinomycetota bacterium]
MIRSGDALASDRDGRSLPPWARRAILSLLVGVAALYYLRGLLEALRPLILVLLVAFFLSFALEPAVNRLERAGLRRGLGTALVMVALVAALGGFGIQVGSLLAEQVTEFSENVPAYLSDVDEWLEDSFGIENATADLRDDYDTGALASWLGDVADDLARFGTTVVNVLFQLFTVGLFTFYLVAEGPKLRRLVCSFIAERHQRHVLEVWDLAIEKTGGYILSRSVLALGSSLVHWAAFEIIGLPSALALALWVGIMSQFIPVVGTFIAGALPLVIALLGEPVDGFWVVVVIAVYQQIENYVLGPRITSHTMQLHVAVAFGSVIAGAAILGVVGALLALPAAATIQAVIAAEAERHEVAEHLQEASSQRRGHGERLEPPSDNPDDARG